MIKCIILYLKTLIGKILVSLIILLILRLLLLSTSGYSADFLKLRKTSLEVGRYLPSSYTEESSELDHDLIVRVDVDLMCLELNSLCLYANSQGRALSYEGDYNFVSSSVKLGLAFSKYVELGWEYAPSYSTKLETIERRYYIQLFYFNRPRQLGW